MSSNFVIATTTYCRDPADVQARLTVRTVKEARSRFTQIVVADRGSSPQFVAMLKSAGATVCTAEGSPGQATRLALKEAMDRATGGHCVVWMPSWMYKAVSAARQLAERIHHNKFDLCLAFRTANSMKSHPAAQIAAETRVNQFFRGLLPAPKEGRRVKSFTPLFKLDQCDPTLGVFAIGARTLPFFLEYAGNYGDNVWDAILVPIMQIIADSSMKKRTLSANRYKFPEELLGLVEKRKLWLELADVEEALVEEAIRLGWRDSHDRLW